MHQNNYKKAKLIHKAYIIQNNRNFITDNSVSYAKIINIILKRVISVKKNRNYKF